MFHILLNVCWIYLTIVQVVSKWSLCYDMDRTLYIVSAFNLIYNNVFKSRGILATCLYSMVFRVCCTETVDQIILPDKNIRYTLQWRHNESDSVSKHQPQNCLLSCLFRRRSKKTSKLRVIGLCAVNSPVTGEFPAQMASNTENVSIWWRHHDMHHTWIEDLCFRRKYLCQGQVITFHICHGL